MGLLDKLTPPSNGAAPAVTAAPAVVYNGPRWQYEVVRLKDRHMEGRAGAGTLERRFNELGAQGWELCGFQDERAVFKRLAI